MTDIEEQIIAYAKDGVRPYLIAEFLKIDRGKIYSTIARVRKQGLELPRVPRGRLPHTIESTQRTVAFPISVLDYLKPAAEARGISVSQLARKLLTTIIDEGLVDSVLDDDEGRPR